MLVRYQADFLYIDIQSLIICVLELCLYVGAKLFKKQENSASTTDHHEEFINLARETVNARGLQQKNHWANINNPFPHTFEPLLVPYLGAAGARAMRIHRDNATNSFLTASIPEMSSVHQTPVQV